MLRIRVEKQCKWCAALFTVPPSRIRIQCCSRKCKYALMSRSYAGHAVSPETRAKIARGRLGQPSSLKGAKYSEQHKANIAAAKRGIKNPQWAGGKTRQQCRCGTSFETYRSKHCSRACAKRGQPVTDVTRARIRLALTGKPCMKIRGANHPHWKGGISGWQNKIRSSLEYKEWRKAVYARDDYTCRQCGARGVELNADHIKPFALFPELRFELSNGRTLCVPCHKKTPTYGNNSSKYIAAP